MCCRHQKTFYVIVVILLLALFIFAGWWRGMHQANPATLKKELSRINQDPVYYVVDAKPKLVLSAEQQAQLTQRSLELYFLPWAESAVDNTKVLNKVQQDIQYYTQHANWQFVMRKFSAPRLNAIIANADLSGFPQINRPGIVIHTAQVRIFPTLLPDFNDPKLAGEGYPFDNWIASYLYPGAPLRILQSSKDQLWYLIKTPSFYGWILASDVAFVSPEFINEWKSHPFIVALRDNVPLYNSQKRVIANLRIGLIYPSSEPQRPELVPVSMPLRDANGDAQITTLWAHTDEVHTFPIPATQAAIANMARNLIGGQYGWGDLYELRDCSATTSDILSGFGLWLPRNSSLQGLMGKVIPLAGLSPKQKIKIFSEQAIPYFTIVHFPGHIALYIGMRNGIPYVLQDAWGVHTIDMLGRDGRAVIGQTVITPLTFANKFSNVKETQLNLADSISILTPDTYTDLDSIKKNVGE